MRFLFNTFGDQTLGKQYREDRYNSGKSQSKKVSFLFHVLQLLSYFNTLFVTKPFMCCVKRVKYIFISLELVVFSLCLFPLVSHVVVLLNFAHELLCTTRVGQPEDFRRKKLILIILPTQDKKKNIYYKVCPGVYGSHSVFC